MALFHAPVYHWRIPKERVIEMTPERGAFSAKLAELDAAYGRMNSRLRQLQSADASELKNQLRALDEEDRRCSEALETGAGSRLPFAAALAKLQLKYERGVDDLLSSEIDSGLDSSGKVEASALTAEHMIDVATSACRHALMAATAALLWQSESENKKQARNSQCSN